MHKTRTGTSVDFGVIPGGGYISSYIITGPKGPCPDEAEALVESHLGDPLPYVQSHWGPFGSQEFWSTEHPRPRWNDCRNLKLLRTFSYPYSFMYEYNNWKNCVFTIARLPQLGFSTRETALNDLTLDAGTFVRARAWASMAPRFESDFQALNFLFELKDWRTIGAGIAKNLHKLGRPFTVPGISTLRKVNRQHEAPLKDLTCADAFSGGSQSVASLWLLNAMAIQPLLKDMAAFTAAMATEYLDALDKFKEAGTKPNTRHYSEVLRDEGYRLAACAQIPTGAADYRIVNHTKFTASMEYTYNYNLSDINRAFAQYWGLTGSAEEFWNMLPFSFLLDYVLNVAKALKLAKIDKNLELLPSQYCESTLQERGIVAGLNPAGGSLCTAWVNGKFYPTNPGKFVPIQGHMSSDYIRKIREPIRYGLILPQWKLPNVTQLWNVAALAKVCIFH